MPLSYSDVVGQKDFNEQKKMLLKHQYVQGAGLFNDYVFFAFNQHPALSVCAAHKAHPFSNKERLVVLLLTAALAWSNSALVSIEAWRNCGSCNVDEVEGTCWRPMIGNKFCNTPCRVEDCNFDVGEDEDGNVIDDCEGNFKHDTCDENSCPESWRGDGFCDTECLIEACDYDCRDVDGTRQCDCVGSDGQQQCSVGCSSDMLGNGVCDEDCNTPPCGFDNGDCGGGGGGDRCSVRCPPSWQGDGFCDPECNLEACNFDNGDCAGVQSECAAGCRTGWPGDGYCDTVCNNAACNYDCSPDGNQCDCNGGDTGGFGDDPGHPSSGGCPTSCPPSWRGDGTCDTACDLAACEWDNGDCQSGSDDCPTGCPTSWRGDGTCDTACDLAACEWDNGDCQPTSGCPSSCPPSWRGDGMCDADCNLAACDWDNGDCPGRRALTSQPQPRSAAHAATTARKAKDMHLQTRRMSTLVDLDKLPPPVQDCFSEAESKMRTLSFAVLLPVLLVFNTIMKLLATCGCVQGKRFEACAETCAYIVMCALTLPVLAYFAWQSTRLVTEGIDFVSAVKSFAYSQCVSWFAWFFTSGAFFLIQWYRYSRRPEYVYLMEQYKEVGPGKVPDPFANPEVLEPGKAAAAQSTTPAALPGHTGNPMGASPAAAPPAGGGVLAAALATPGGAAQVSGMKLLTVQVYEGRNVRPAPGRVVTLTFNGMTVATGVSATESSAPDWRGATLQLQIPAAAAVHGAGAVDLAVVIPDGSRIWYRSFPIAALAEPGPTGTGFNAFVADQNGSGNGDIHFAATVR